MEILIYALIAAFFAWRLFSTLGTRHEGEQQRPNPFAPPTNEAQGSRAPDKEMLALPLSKPAPMPASLKELAGDLAPNSLSGALYALQKAEPSFDEKSFVKGARVAFELIVHAFAAGDTEALKPLVSPVLFEAFSGGVAARAQSGEKLEMKLLNVIEAHITAARVEGRFAFVTVEFTSDQSRMVSVSGTVKEDSGVQRLHDLWTFRRETGAPDPNWMLVETKTA